MCPLPCFVFFVCVGGVCLPVFITSQKANADVARLWKAPASPHDAPAASASASASPHGVASGPTRAAPARSASGANDLTAYVRSYRQHAGGAAVPAAVPLPSLSRLVASGDGNHRPVA